MMPGNWPPAYGPMPTLSLLYGSIVLPTAYGSAPAPAQMTYTVPWPSGTTVGAPVGGLPAWSEYERSYSWSWPLMTRSTWYLSKSGASAPRAATTSVSAPWLDV